MTDHNTIFLSNLRRIRDEIDAQIAAIEAEPSKCVMEWAIRFDDGTFGATLYCQSGNTVQVEIKYPDAREAYREHQGAKP
jgi:hypothetical protein